MPWSSSKRQTASEERRYLEEIKNDMSYFRRPYQRAHIHVSLAGLGPKGVALKVKAALEQSAAM